MRHAYIFNRTEFNVSIYLNKYSNDTSSEVIRIDKCDIINNARRMLK